MRSAFTVTFRPALLKYVTIASCALILSGCFERHRSTDSLCESHPQICEQLNVRDGQCRLQRTKLIWKRFDVMNNPIDTEKFKELKFTYDYQMCLEYAARIEPTEHKERKTKRMKALIHSYDSIKRLNNELAESIDPEIIYYRWSQGDKRAMRQFLKLEGKPALETPELQLALATYYNGKDQVKTQNILLHALSLYQQGDKIQPEIIQTLATIAHQQKDSANAYLWIQVGKEFDMPSAEQDKLARFYPMAEDAREALDKKAKRIVKALKKGKFHSGYL
ncbi:hypothetical protein A3K86_13575 [Photobacterium jeanii]|uniref:DUF2989 domain-containing protein n=1 Tax=Photobacterium jeanii TaxID=858640 RepID=A0A178K967_9GAMM|nr:DUF2989 domain-containing protein [Photobacterium jeanii]OAN13606.1 hypothetical protein A3K86_13575 [Photobacterium jeanii]PST88724.1 DUF2989 domain-containing protein [Photobacterium jeanii]